MRVSERFEYAPSLTMSRAYSRSSRFFRARSDSLTSASLRIGCHNANLSLRAYGWFAPISTFGRLVIINLTRKNRKPWMPYNNKQISKKISIRHASDGNSP